MFRFRFSILVALLAAFVLLTSPAKASISTSEPSAQFNQSDFQSYLTGRSPSTQDGVAGCVDNSNPTGPGQNISIDSASHPNPWAGLIWVRIPQDSSTTTPTFCTDLVTGISAGDCFQTDNNNPLTACPITWLLNNDYGPDASESNAENAARQAAVWYFSDGVNVLSGDPVYARTQEIINAVPQPCVLPSEPPVMAIDPQSAINFLPGGESHLLTVSVTQDGSPVASQDVDLSTDFGTLSANNVTTDANGEATFTITNNATGTANITASFPYQLPSGTRFTKLDGAEDQQVIVLGTPEDSEVSTTATKTWEEGTLIIAHKFNDSNTNGVQNSGEENLSGWEMTLQMSDGQGGWTDVNSDNTDQNGNVVFDGLAPGTYRVIETQQSGWVATTPNPSDSVTLAAGEQAVIDFGNVPLAVIKAYKFHDLNGDGIRQDNEPLLDGWTMNIDPASNGIGHGDTVGGAVSFIDLEPDTYTVWETQQDGWCATTDESVDVTVGPNDFAEVWFGNHQCPKDWGDAPDTYGTDATDGGEGVGPSHPINPNIGLGPVIDAEIQGQPTPGADGDDNNPVQGPDDEDGVDFGANGPMAGVCTEDNPIDITYHNDTGSNAYIYAWMDFNANGVFDNPTELIVDAEVAVDNNNAGTTLNLTYDIPCDAVATTTSYVRVRIDTADSGVLPTGPGSIGEVEDYLFMQKGWDFGDVSNGSSAPDLEQTSYSAPTTNLNVGDPARHLLVDGLVLGSCVDMETDGTNPNIPPFGDDVADTADSLFTTCSNNPNDNDEDGFAGRSPDWSSGSGDINVSVSNVPTAGACVYGYIDWDRDGFTVDDGVANNGGNSFDTAMTNADGPLVLTFNSGVPDSGSFPTGVDIPVRLRVVAKDDTGACSSPDSPIGAMTGGEVEDHKISFSTTTAVDLHEMTTAMPTGNLLWIGAAVLVLLTAVVLGKRKRSQMLD